MRWLALLLMVGGCTEPPAVPRTYVVGGAWVVFLGDETVCLQEELYRAPEMDKPEEAIAACRAAHR